MAGDRGSPSGVLRGGLPGAGALLRDDFVQAYGQELPAVVQCFTVDFDARIAHLRFPLRHRKVIRATSPRAALPRGAAPDEDHFARLGERLVLKLMYAPVIRAADRWRGITLGEFEQRQLRAIREQPNRAHAERSAPAVAPTQNPPVRKLRADR